MPILSSSTSTPTSALKQTVVTFGDSITNQNFNAAASYSADIGGYWTWAQVLLRHRFSLLANSGNSGYTTTQLLPLLDSQVIAYSPGWCVVEGGVNDVVQGVSYATITANLQAIYGRLIAAGIRVVATTITPTTSADTAAEKTVLYAVNYWIRSYARVTPGIVLCDWFGAQADPTTGDPKTGFTTDGTHPSGTGAYWMGRALYNALAPVSSVQDLLPFSNAEPTSILPNPMMVGDTAGLADSITFGTVVTVAPVAVTTKVARTDGVNGEWQQINASSAADGWQVSQNNSTAGSLWNVADTVYATCEVECDSGGAVDSANGKFPYSLELLFYNGTGAIRDLRSQASAAAVTVIPTERLVLRTPNMVVPASTTRVYCRLQSYITGANVRIGRMQIVKV